MPRGVLHTNEEKTEQSHRATMKIYREEGDPVSLKEWEMHGCVVDVLRREEGNLFNHRKKKSGKNVENNIDG